jgi:DNA polymerase II large subunit
MAKPTERIKNYFSEIDGKLEVIYKIAEQAKKIGIDPSDKVEMPVARDISERVEGILSAASEDIVGKGMPQRINELEKIYGKLDWRVALEISLEVAQEKFCKFENKAEAMSLGVKAGLTYLTLGIVSAPLEGFIGFEIKKRRDGKEYLAMGFAGPIRAAGGTAGAVFVLVGDYVRKKMGYSEYDPDEREVNRYYTELMDYNDRCVRLQYIPSEEETKFLISKIPIEITGDPTEKIEVSNFKDLPRVPTNRIRGGMCLVIGECIIQKAPKINRRLEEWGIEMELGHWTFLADFLKLQKEIKSRASGDTAKTVETEEEKKNKPRLEKNFKFIQDIVAGRPIFTFPMEKGGFRLRYGRNRTSGFASTSVSAQTMEILQDFLAVGTQLKLERPGKATVVTPCDTIEGPVVKLKSGEIKKLETIQMAREYKNQVEEIVHVGDILIGYGEFSENNHPLVPNGYCEEEWALELIEKINAEHK